jgi:hypothetical protein
MRKLLLALTFIVLGTQVAMAQTPVTCEQAANTLAGDPGAAMTVLCPAGCGAASVWGTGVYSDDSSICTAAVHSGVLAPGSGGPVQLTIVGGQPAYVATTQNGVTSSSWGEWNRSFAVSQPAGGAIACDVAANQYGGDAGARLSVVCPAGCESNAVWGTGIYSDDSSICAAAIHAGLIPASGGPVMIEIAPGMPAYIATTQNGVTSYEWGEWGRSFIVLPPGMP